MQVAMDRTDGLPEDLATGSCPGPRTAQDEEDARLLVREALNDYLGARRRLQRESASLEAAQAVLVARVRLVHVLTESGWSPPSEVRSQLVLDEALLHEPAREHRVRA